MIIIVFMNVMFLIQNSVGGYTCDCAMGFMDPTCTNIDECLENECQNGAECIVSLV